MLSDEELQHLLTLRSGYQERIRLLEERQARRGELPSGEALELAQARRDMEAVEARLQTTPISQDVWRAVGRDAHTIILEYRVKVVEDKLNDGLLVLNTAINQIRDEVKADVQQVQWLITRALIIFGALFLAALLITERWR